MRENSVFSVYQQPSFYAQSVASRADGGDMPFLRMATEELPDGSLRFLNAVKEGMRLNVGRPADIVETTRMLMERVKAPSVPKQHQ